MLRELLKTLITALFIPTSLAAQSAVPAQQQTSTPLSQAGIERITREVRHELVLLPYYGVFDNLAYRVCPGWQRHAPRPSRAANPEI